MRPVTAFVMFLLGFLPPAPLLAAGAANAMLVQANAALTSGQYDTARALAASGLAEGGVDAPVRSRLLVIRGLAHQSLGQAENALVDFTAALQGGVLMDEERARALFARGLTLDGQGRFALAISDYTAALTFAPRAPYALNNRANVYRRQGRLADARRDYAAALEAPTPTPQYPWFGLGQIAEVEGDSQTARSYYSRALTADPDFVLARERLQAMGAPVEEPAGLPTDTGVIVLRTPPPRGEDAPILLMPPRAEAVPATAVRRPAPVIPVAKPARVVQPPPGRGAPLRPAIVENSPTPPPVGRQVQLGAWRSQGEAEAGWEAARRAAGGLLDGMTPIIVMAVLPGRGTFYRLRTPAQGTAGQFCVALQARGLDCLPARD